LDEREFIKLKMSKEHKGVNLFVVDLHLLFALAVERGRIPLYPKSKMGTIPSQLKKCHHDFNDG
jgi:hypothetical protein